MRELLVAALSFACSPIVAQTMDATARLELVTRSFHIRHCGDAIQSGTEGYILRRLLTSKVGTLGYSPLSRVLVVEDRGEVVAAIAKALDYFDRNPQDITVSRTFPIQYCHDLMLQKGGPLAAVRRVMTPKTGRIEYDEKEHSLFVRDTKPVVDEIASILKHVDVQPLQVFLNVQFVETTNPKLWSLGVVRDAKARKCDFCTLGFQEVVAAWRAIRKDPRTKVTQAPKLVALDHAEATIVVQTTPKLVKDRRLRVVPHVVPGTDKLIVELLYSDVGRQFLVRSGQTIACRYRDTTKADTLVFVTPQIITPPKQR